MDEAIQNFNYLNNLASNQVQTYQQQIASIDHLNTINRITGISGVMLNLQQASTQITKALSGADVVNNSLFKLPNAESDYFKSLKGNLDEVSRSGLNEKGELTLPENRISDFSRKYYNDNEFRNQVENELNNGEGDLTKVAEQNGIRGITSEEANLGYRYGSAYRTFGNNAKLRSPELTEEEIDTKVSNYADRLENGLQSNLKALRDPAVSSKANILEQRVNQISARIKGRPNEEYQLLDDQREQLAGDRINVGNRTFQTQASSGRTQQTGEADDAIEMNDFADIEDLPELNASGANEATDALVENITGTNPSEAVASTISEPTASIAERAPELFEPTTGRTAFPLLEETAPEASATTVPATTSATSAPDVGAGTGAVEEPIGETTGMAEEVGAEAGAGAEAGESLASTAGELAGEVGGAEAMSIFGVAGAVLSPVMALGGLALAGYQLYQLFTGDQSKPPPPAITYSQINEGE